MLAVVTMMRTAGTYLPRFRMQVDALAEVMPLRVIVGENDSRDDTKGQLVHWAANAPYLVTILDCGDNSNHYPSIDIPERWASIAGVMNKVLDEVTEDDDTVMYADADLMWDAALIVRLLAKLDAKHDVVAPLSWHGPSQRPYDTWGTRRRGVRLTAREPWFEGHPCQGLVEVDSAACLNVMDAHWARVARFGETNANVGWHDEMRAKGARIWLDFDERMVHP